MNIYTFTTENETNYFTTAKSNITVAGQEYESVTMKRSKYVLDSVKKKNNITISFPGDNEFARQFIVPTTLTLNVVIATNNGIPFYRGRLVTVHYKEKNMIDMVFEPLIRIGTANMSERRLYQRNCSYELYGRNCQAKIQEHLVTLLDVVSSTEIKVGYDTHIPDNDKRAEPFNVFRTVLKADANINVGRFVGGIVFSGGSSDGSIPRVRHWITNIKSPLASGQYIDFNILVFRPHNLLSSVGNSINIAFGCSRTTEQCRDIHNNIINYGGFPSMVKLSPFEGGLRG